MTGRRAVAGALALAIVVGTVPVRAQQESGVIAGQATDEARQPYSDYAVQLRDVATGQVVSTKVLDARGLFSFLGLGLPSTSLIELVNIKDRKIVCTEGPFTLGPTKPSKLDVNINCGRVPAARWLLLAGAGAAAAVAIATRSTSK